MHISDQYILHIAGFCSCKTGILYILQIKSPARGGARLPAEIFMQLGGQFGGLTVGLCKRAYYKG
jgi:hypothetical protein